MLTPVTLVKNIFKETSKVKWVEANSASWKITLYATILFVEIMNTKKLQIILKNTTKQKTSKQIFIYSTSITTTHKKTVNIESFTMPSKNKIETVLHVNFHKWL